MEQSFLGTVGPLQWQLPFDRSGKLYVALVGLIGVGKTTLAKALAEELGVTYYPEPVQDNPYLDGFYRDLADGEKPSLNATLIQYYLLNERATQQQVITALGDGGVQDRSIYEDPVFARLLCQEGYIRLHDYETYMKSFRQRIAGLQRPNLLVYLDATPEQALERIRARGRPTEKDITLEYLQSLQREYALTLAEIGKLIPVIKVPYAQFQSGAEMAQLIVREWHQISGIHTIK